MHFQENHLFLQCYSNKSGNVNEQESFILSVNLENSMLQGRRLKTASLEGNADTRPHPGVSSISSRCGLLSLFFMQRVFQNLQTENVEKAHTSMQPLKN